MICDDDGIRITLEDHGRVVKSPYVLQMGSEAAGGRSDCVEGPVISCCVPLEVVSHSLLLRCVLYVFITSYAVFWRYPDYSFHYALCSQYHGRGPKELSALRILS